MQKDQIALQLYTVRDAMKADPLGTLQKVAGMGYPAVEFAGLHGVSAADLRSHLDGLGVKAPAAHVPYAGLMDDCAGVCADLRTLGCEFAIVPWIGEEHRGPLDTVHRFAASLNELGQKVKAEGLRFAYHNHDFEFAPVEGGSGETMWDVIMRETDPAIVELELDLYWILYGGGDPGAMVGKAPERYPLLHIKDMTGEGDARRDAPVGSGGIDWAPLLSASEGATAWYVVEQDKPADPLADAGRSLRALQGMATA